MTKPEGTDINVRVKSLYVSETEIEKGHYGDELFEDFLRRHGLEEDDDKIVFIRSAIMNAFFTEN